MTDYELLDEIERMRSRSEEQGWFEFKENNKDLSVLGETLSAVGNMAAYEGRPFGYYVLGIEDGTHQVVGTSLGRSDLKHGNQDLDILLQTSIFPRPDLEIRELQHPGGQLIIFKIAAAKGQPMEFKNIAYGRVGSNTTKLSLIPHVASAIWSGNAEASSFESGDARSGLNWSEVNGQVDLDHFYKAAKIPSPETEGASRRILSAKGILRFDGTRYSITNLGAITLAKRIEDFPALIDRRIRIIWYDGIDKRESPKEDWGTMGYALGLDGLVGYLLERLPSKVVDVLARREVVPVYPRIVLRELIANALVHQDFNVGGERPTISIYSNRIAIENPGRPIIPLDRFIDQDKTRNQRLTAIMRDMHYCEQHGAGVDRVLMAIAMNHLPPPEWSIGYDRTTTTIFGPRAFGAMDRSHKIRGCYQHCVLQWLKTEKMTNSTLRERFGLDKNQYQIASAIISDTVAEGKIKEAEGVTSKRYMSYLPIWA